MSDNNHDELAARWAARVAALDGDPTAIGETIDRVWDNAPQRAELSVPALSSAPVIEELLAHLGAAKMYMLPTDDAIIREHIVAAHALATVLFRGTRV
jgi:hypothetical protein